MADRWAARGSARLEVGQYDHALSDAERALKLDPECINARMLRGFILADFEENERALVDLVRAYELVQKELRRMPRDVWLRCSVADIQLRLFELDARPERLSIAAEHADSASAIAADWYFVWSSRGAVELKRRDFVNSDRDLSRSLELHPHDYWAAWRGWNSAASTRRRATWIGRWPLIRVSHSAIAVARSFERPAARITKRSTMRRARSTSMTGLPRPIFCEGKPGSRAAKRQRAKPI